MEYVEIAPDPDLLAQVITELLDMASDPDHVKTGHGERGMILMVPAELAETWFQSHQNQDAEAGEALEVEPQVEVITTPVVDEPPAALIPDEPPAPSPFQEAGAVPAPREPAIAAPASLSAATKRGPGRPRKVTSASVSEAL